MTNTFRKRSAFTLVELLVVVLIISLLIAMVSGGILASIRNARKRRNAVIVQTLNTAIQNYRHEYGDWPHPGSAGSEETATYAENNYEVFNRLHPAHSANPKEIRFLEEGRFLTERDGERMFLHEARSSNSASGEFPIIDPIDGRPYKVTFNFDNDTVNVTKQ